MRFVSATKLTEPTTETLAHRLGYWTEQGIQSIIQSPPMLFARCPSIRTPNHNVFLALVERLDRLFYLAQSPSRLWQLQVAPLPFIS